MYRTIVVPLDGSKRAEAIFRHVEDLARQFSSRVVLVRVLEPVTSIVGAEGTHMALSREIMQQQERDAELYLAGVRGEFGQHGINAETRVVIGPVVAGILSIAQQEKADLIAMASHGRSGVARVFYGSVAAGVLQRVDRPLLIVRSRRT